MHIFVYSDQLSHWDLVPEKCRIQVSIGTSSHTVTSLLNLDQNLIVNCDVLRAPFNTTVVAKALLVNHGLTDGDW